MRPGIRKSLETKLALLFYSNGELEHFTLFFYMCALFKRLIVSLTKFKPKNRSPKHFVGGIKERKCPRNGQNLML